MRERVPTNPPQADEPGPTRGVAASDAALDVVAHSIARSSPDNIMVLDIDARIRFINYTVPDLTIDRVLGTAVYDYVPAEFRDQMRRCFERVKATAAPDRYETAYVAENGDISVWESRVGPVVPETRVEGFVVISSNITERRMAAADRDRFFDLSLDMLCVSSLEGYFLRVNPAFERTLGFEDRELLATPLLDFVHPDDRAASRAQTAKLGAGEPAIDFENRYRRKDGEYRWISWRAVPDTQRRHIYAVGRDVTERKQLEAQLLGVQKLDAVGRLAGGIAHDFNNLLQAIQLNAESAQLQSKEPLLARHMAEIRSAAQRAADLTRQLLAVSRRQPMQSAPLDLGAAIAEIFGLLRRLIPEDIAIVVDTTAEACVVLADRGQFEQVLLNLCLNARDAMPAGGQLRIALRPVRLDSSFCSLNAWARPGAYCLLTVSDTGTGILEEARDHVFEPFYTTKAPGLGSGLGLATTYGIVKAHGGLLHFESGAAGTTFEVYLPGQAGTVVPLPTSSHASPPALDAGRGETLLVAEDDSMVRIAVVELLERAGYHVIQAEDGEQAIELFKRHEREIRLLVLDVVMPRLSGPQTLERIRRLAPHVRAVICSGYEDGGGPSAPLNTPVIHKPYDRQTLLRRVREELDR